MLIGTLLCIVGMAPGTLPPAPPGAEWKMIWKDEFSGKSLDSSKWENPEYKRRDAHWVKEAATVDGKGHLALKVWVKDGEVYDGCARTKGRFEHAYGYYETRMKLDKSPGHWPAFWLFNNTQGNIGNGGVDGCEIDIMETPWEADKVNFALHWDGYEADHKSTGSEAEIPDLHKGWHTFGLSWLPGGYTWYVDGKSVYSTSTGGVCRVPNYIKLSDEFELKGWAGEADLAKLPDETLVDYVRVYDLLDTRTKKPLYPVPAESIPKP